MNHLLNEAEQDAIKKKKLLAKLLSATEKLSRVNQKITPDMVTEVIVDDVLGKPPGK